MLNIQLSHFMAEGSHSTSMHSLTYAVYCACVFVFLQVTHNQLNVLDLSWLEEGSELAHEELEPLSRNMAASLRQLIEQRDKASEVLRLSHNNQTTTDIGILLVMIKDFIHLILYKISVKSPVIIAYFLYDG